MLGIFGFAFLLVVHAVGGGVSAGRVRSLILSQLIGAADYIGSAHLDGEGVPVGNRQLHKSIKRGHFGGHIAIPVGKCEHIQRQTALLLVGNQIFKVFIEAFAFGLTVQSIIHHPGITVGAPGIVAHIAD